MTDLPQQTVLQLAGDIGIRSAEAVRGRLLEALRPGGDVIVDCTGATDPDLTTLQLIAAARRAAEGAGHRLTLRPPVAGALLAVADAAGLLAADEGFWTGTGE